MNDIIVLYTANLDAMEADPQKYTYKSIARDF